MEMTRRVAAYRKCAFYNYYDIAGSGGSMAQWYKRALAKPDKIHLTTPGYYLKGELYLNAILNSYAAWLGKKEDSLIAQNHAFDTTQLKNFFLEDISFKKENSKTEFVPVYREPETNNDLVEKNDRTYYTIRSGDNLGAIAERFHVSVKDLQYWNAMSGTRIIAGETLVIYKKSHSTPTPVQNRTETKTQPTNNTAITPVNRNNTRKAVYKVASGDSLWTIAKKYNTTVESLKKLNNLKSDKLSIGQTLIIP
jgi:LysM repeat protein